jgi:mRNA interferase MazF
MEKAFDAWNEKKKVIDKYAQPRFCYPREVWWCSLGVNVGFEEDGKGEDYRRPVVVITGFNERIFFAVALTGREKKGKYYLSLGTVGGKASWAILSQVRLIDSKRLIRKIGTLDTGTFERLKDAVKIILFP